MKEIADATGVSVTFMAKPVTGEAGSSCHVHVSLWQDDSSAFSDDGGSDTDAFRWFLGGWMAHVGDVMAFYAPTVNSYKRYQPGSWAPVGIAWSEDNRTAGFRVVGSGASRRIECRLPGADCNPYLVYAAVLASGLDGIANKTEPPAEFVGDVYQARDLPRVPATLREAATAFAKSDFAREAFGAEVHEHYSHFFDVEATQYDNAVTDWERWRYFERI
jgi:glutamine synthetase